MTIREMTAYQVACDHTMKITGTPHPDGSCAWRAGQKGHEDRIGVARNRHPANPIPEWWAWCGRCDWEPLGPGGEGMHRTWQEAQDAAAAHAAVCPIHEAAAELAAYLTKDLT